MNEQPERKWKDLTPEQVGTLAENKSPLLWRELHDERDLSLIPLIGKAPFESDWQKWCREQRPFHGCEYIGKNAGIACGPASGLIVLDIDDLDRFRKYAEGQKWRLPTTLEVMTGSGKFHYYFRYPKNGTRYRNRTFKEHGFDIRADGGCVVAPGSVHPDTGKLYEISLDVRIAEAPEWFLGLAADEEADGDNDMELGNPVEVDPEDFTFSDDLRAFVTEGAIGKYPSRSEAGFALICSMLSQGAEPGAVYHIFENYPCGLKYRGKGGGRHRWLADEIKRARRYLSQNVSQAPGDDTAEDQSPHVEYINISFNTHARRSQADETPEKNAASNDFGDLNETADENRSQQPCDGHSKSQFRSQPSDYGKILDCLANEGKWTTIDEVSRWTGIKTVRTKTYLHRASDLGDAERHPQRAGAYRRVLSHIGFVDYRNVEQVEPISLALPGGFHEYADIHPGSLIVLAGEPGSGKSTYFFNFIRLNDHDHRIVYTSTELNRHEVNIYLRRFEQEADPRFHRLMNDWRFHFREEVARPAADYPDLIVPDAINILDWFQFSPDDYPNLDTYLRRMKSRVGSGVVLVAIQKDEGVNTAKGKQQSEYAATIHMTMWKEQGGIDGYVILKKVRYIVDDIRLPEGQHIRFRNPRGAKLQFEPLRPIIAQGRRCSTSVPFPSREG